jgi:nucleoside 2-deoxyribosyltransferase/sugar/nucleoside kinase (ribokinase family)
MMLTVIGGTYREVCLEPPWDQRFGSGFRAAVACSEILRDGNSQVRLISWAAESERAELEMRAASYELELEIHSRLDAIEFQYDHGLSIPRILPDPDEIQTVAPQRWEEDHVLLFSMLEDSPQDKEPYRNICVDAQDVVYDPQAESRSVPFSRTGSKARRLAIVANLVEAEAMARALNVTIASGAHRPTAVGQALQAAEGAEVVVVKNGAEGAFVVTKEDTHHVASYKTERLFKLGSGDVFSGIFSAYWLESQADPVEAAERASAAAAYYCTMGGLGGLPIPVDPDDIARSGIELHRVPFGAAGAVRKKVYIAGPLFSFAHRWFISEVRRCLHDQGVKTFSPYHEVGLLSADAPLEEMRRVAAADLQGLKDCAAVFAIVDGLDAGTLFEIGYAVSLDIPVVAFGQRVRKEDLVMIEGSPRCRICHDFPTAIYQAAWAALES